MLGVMTTSNGESSVEAGLGAQIKGRISAAHDALDQLLAPEFTRLGLTAGEADVLTVLLLADNESLAPTELAGWLGLTTAGLTARLNALEERTLIERRLHPTDGRRRTLHFTSEGEQLARTVMKLKDEVINEHIVAALGQVDAQALIAHLDTVITTAIGVTAQRVPR